MSNQDAKNQRYSRIARYSGFADTLDEWQRSTVAVVGLGGLGGGLAELLVRMGAGTRGGRLLLIDRDVVLHENLGHQRLFTEAHARDAVPKAIAARDALLAINPDSEIDAQVAALSFDNAAELLSGCGMLFDGLDNYFARLLLNDYALSEGIALFYAGVVRGELSAKAVVPGVTSCLRCILPKPPRAGDVPTCSSEGVFPPLLGVANALQIDMANRWLAGSFTAEDDILYSMRLPDWQIRQVEMSGPAADCPACNGDYEYLRGALGSQADYSCSEGEVSTELVGTIDLPALATTLARSGNFSISGSRWSLRAEDNGVAYTLFSSGRIVMSGSGDPAMLERFVNTELGL